MHLLRPGGLRPWAPTGWRENVTTYELRVFLVRHLCDPGHPRNARENVTTCALRVFLVRQLCDPGHPRDARENVTMCALRVVLVRQLGTNDVRELHQSAPWGGMGGTGLAEKICAPFSRSRPVLAATDKGLSKEVRT